MRDAPERRHEARFVGRERELALLREAWERVRAEQRCELVTVVGDAGVGKSRLAAELLASIEATVVRGRCLPYGEGITYWPVVEVLKQLDVLPPDEAAAAAIRSLLGETDAATSAEEIAWAFRKTLEQAAAERPLVVVFDDIQWGEETFLDLIEHVALLSSGASILLLCIARPELTERRPAWPVTLRLEPLRRRGRRRARSRSGSPASCARRSPARRAATRSSSRRCWRWPARRRARWSSRPRCRRCSRRASTSSRPAERSVLERGAIEGEIFHRGAVQALAPEETQVTPRLAALVRKELIRPDRPQLAGEDGFRFRHLLIRDAAYDALPKATRADLHERFAAWLEEHGAELVELDEILGYHLEQACRYRAELGMPDDDDAGRGGAAAPDRRRPPRAPPRRTTAPPRACSSAPPRSLPPAELDLALETELVDALFWTGKGRRRAPARGCPRRAGRGGGRSCRRALREDPGGLIRIYLEPEGATEELAALVEQALPVFEAAGDDLALTSPTPRSRRWRIMRGQMDAALEAYERASPTLGGRATCRIELLGWRAALSLLRHDPRAGAARRGSTSNEPRAGRDHFLRAYRAGALAMLGRFDEARAILAEDACGAGGARRGTPAREPHRLRVRLGRALGRRSRRRSRVRSRRVQAARGAGGTEASSRTRPGAWRGRSTRSTGSTRPTPGPAARRSSARATTP